MFHYTQIYPTAVGLLCSTPICDTSLNPEDRVARFIGTLHLQEKVDNLVSGALGVPRLTPPPYQWSNEVLHGISDIDANKPFDADPNATWASATSFPMPLLLGAAFDDGLVYQVATTIGKKSRAFANHGRFGRDVWAPNINPFKDPRWGRGIETPGEDPLYIQNYV